MTINLQILQNRILHQSWNTRSLCIRAFISRLVLQYFQICNNNNKTLIIKILVCAFARVTIRNHKPERDPTKSFIV